MTILQWVGTCCLVPAHFGCPVFLELQFRHGKADTLDGRLQPASPGDERVFTAPVELEGFAGFGGEWHAGLFAWRFCLLLMPAPHERADAAAAACVALAGEISAQRHRTAAASCVLSFLFCVNINTLLGVFADSRLASGRRQINLADRPCYLTLSRQGYLGSRRP